jgi:hypothetical protein
MFFIVRAGLSLRSQTASSRCRLQVARWAAAKMAALAGEMVVLGVRLRGGARLYSLRGDFKETVG